MNKDFNKFSEVSKDNRVPFYLQVKDQLFHAIINNLEVGDKIDTEINLSKIFGVSRPTIRQAVKELENEGFLSRTKGFGTFVKSKKIETALMQDVAFFTEELEARHIKFINKILLKEKIVPKKEAAQLLKLQEGEKVNYIERLRLVMEQPLYFTLIHIPDMICKDFIENDLVNNSSTGLIESKYGIYIQGIKRYIYPVSRHLYPRPADILNIGKNECFFYMKSILFHKKDKPIAFYEDFFSNEKSEFTFYTKR
jgi:GntR family transcriptional regulator